MGLMDKVKPLASQLAQKTQSAATEGKAKLDQVQAARRGDALLRNLGATVYADRTGRGSGDSQGKIDRLVSDISAHEQSNGLNLAGNRFQPPAQRQAPDGGTRYSAEDTSASVPEQPGAAPPETEAGFAPDEGTQPPPDEDEGPIV
jgi:hypothetical protein